MKKIMIFATIALLILGMSDLHSQNRTVTSGFEPRLPDDLKTLVMPLLKYTSVYPYDGDLVFPDYTAVQYGAKYNMTLSPTGGSPDSSTAITLFKETSFLLKTDVDSVTFIAKVGSIVPNTSDTTFVRFDSLNLVTAIDTLWRLTSLPPGGYVKLIVQNMNPTSTLTPSVTGSAIRDRY